MRDGEPRAVMKDVAWRRRPLCVGRCRRSCARAAGGQGLDRAFITGVSPVVLSDMTSGYNVGENIYLADKFNDLCGFTEAEIAAVLDCSLSATKSLIHRARETLKLRLKPYLLTGVWEEKK